MLRRSLGFVAAHFSTILFTLLLMGARPALLSAAPAVTSFSPASGPVGTDVTVHGSGFASTTQVTFNGTAAAFTANNNRLIHTTVPPGATSGPISVTTPDGTASSTSAFTVTHPPRIDGFSPSSGPVGTEVTVTGVGFATATQVAFNGIAASFTADGDTLLHATVPAGTSSGTLAVTNPDGIATSDSIFIVTAPPIIAGFSPSSGPVGTEVTVNGSGFITATQVAFNGLAAGFVVNSDTLLYATVPADATSGPLSVTNPDGIASSGSDFTVKLPPTITGFSPTAGPVGTGVTVTGSGFTTATQVALNATVASFVVDSDTLLSATVPPGATSGPLAVSGDGGTATSAKPFTVTAQMGYRAFCFGDSANSTPTGEKPESKLWWNDGIWWGSLWNPILYRNEIHRFDPSTNTWITTGVPIDDRDATKGDALWDGVHLYFVSHIFTINPVPTVPGTAGRLYRFSYDPGTDRYSLDPGFPVTLNGSKSETLVLAKDSLGRLWVTWVEAGKVKVNSTLGDDRTWGIPFELPVQGEDASLDDISSLIAFGTEKIGIMWSNQVTQATYFAVHVDSDPAGTWQTRETILADSLLGPMSDDHINLKTLDGVVYAATKTNLMGLSSPLVYVCRRDTNGTWTNHLVSRKIHYHTRPIVLLDPDNGLIHVLAASDVTGKEVVYRKSASLADLVFPDDLGATFVDSPVDYFVGNITSTKQNLTSASGLLALASDQESRYYLFNFLPSPTVAVVPGNGIPTSQASVALMPGLPNPFFQATRLRFALPSSGRTRLEVFDLSGRAVRTLLDRDLEAGPHEVTWDGRDRAANPVGVGIYFVRLQSPIGRTQRSVVRLR